VGNPAEETYRYPNKSLILYLNSRTGLSFVNHLNRAVILAHLINSSTGICDFLAPLLLSSTAISNLKTRCVNGSMCSSSELSRA
jgi:hypothetical protein